MDLVSTILRDASVVLFGMLALASVRDYRRGRGSSAAWAAMTFCSVGVVLLAALVFPESIDTAAWLWAGKVLVAVLVCFPYFLYRFSQSFTGPARWMDRTATALTAVVVLGAFALPRFPDPAEPRPWWLVLYQIALVVQWATLSWVVATRLWKGGRGQASVVRWRARLMGTGSAGVSVAVLLSSLTSGADPSVLQVLSQSLTLLAGLAFFMGLAPPYMFLQMWRRPEQRAAREAIAGLMSATTPAEVGDILLPHVASIIGAHGATLFSARGSVIASYHSGSGAVSRVASTPYREPLRWGYIEVETSPMTPFFGAEELGMLKSLANLTDIRLERCAGIERERSFISNAAHELRTPVTAMSGLIETVSDHRHRMDEDQLNEAFASMRRQSERARELMANLLDLARLDRGEARVADEQVHLAGLVRYVVAEAPPPDDREVDVRIPEHLSVMGDASRLQQVLVNLLVNAYRYGGWSIRIDAASSAKAVHVFVSDNGSGVPADLVPTLFEPFSRGVDATGIGSGLGLAICDRIVGSLGGTISYEPAEPAGSCFHLTLRAAA